MTHLIRSGWGKRLLSLLMVCSVLLASTAFGGFVYADELEDSLTDLEGQQAELQEEKAAVQAEVDALQAEQMTLLEQKVLLDQQMNLTVAEIALVNDQIAAYEELITAKEAELEQRKAEEQLQLEAYRTRLRAMEEAGDVTYYQIIFGASSFSDLLSRIDCIGEIMECDKTLHEDMVAARRATEEAEAALEAGKASLLDKQNELEALKDEQARRIEEASALIRQIEENISEYELYRAEIEAEEANVQGQIDDVMAEMARIEAERIAAEEAARLEQERLEAEAAAGGESSDDDGYSWGTGAGGGGYIWPTATTLITSYWGNRLHPIYNEWRFHSGIDIGADYGEAIYAAKEGEVVTATYDEGYGNYVMIYHPDGSATLYAHMSEILCYGGYVSQGEVIGLVGSTGYSTGPHLHFEIHEGGGTIDPLLYLS